MRSLRILLLSFAALWLLAGCSGKVNEPALGIYRATLALPGGDAPFGLEVSKEGERYTLHLLNGSERTQVNSVKVADKELIAVFPGYENSLQATMYSDRLEGSVTLIKAGGVEQIIPFKAVHGEKHRFFADSSTDNVDAAGRWEVTLIDDDGDRTNAVAILEQSHDRVTGTVMTPTGDHRFLDGQVRGSELWLSTFAGGLAYLYQLRSAGEGRLEGEYWQGLKSHEKVTAIRKADAALTHVTTTMQSDRLDFTFNDVDGKPVSLSDERFRGKVVLITLGGTWCPNCHDEAAFLVPFYREYRNKGFEVVALMFERHAQFDKAAKAVRNYQQDMGIEFPMLIAGTADDSAGKALPTLSGIYGYPTTIFVDKQGKVRKIHTGFTGPAAPQEYEEYTSEFKALVDELLAET
jgi:thiol-disulfide isomerase/thioredoxin